MPRPECPVDFVDVNMIGGVGLGVGDKDKATMPTSHNLKTLAVPGEAKFRLELCAIADRAL